MKKILIVEDEVNLITLLSRTLTDEGHRVSIASTCDMAIIMVEGTVFDTIIIDQDMPEINGMELIERFWKLYPGLPIIIITENGTIEQAVEALRKGAYDFITKPLDPDKIGPMVKRALAYGELYLDLKQLRKGIQNEYAFSSIIAKSRCMQNNLVLIDQIADNMTAPILIQGEPGTGKEMLARAIHDRSTRKDKPFLAVDCSAIPEGLLEEMLFGRVDTLKENCTNCNCTNYKGIFDYASGGTIFLDEVDDISLATQSKLLRVIQEREIRPIGSNQARKIDVRIIAATSKNLRELIKKQTFREDLYFRIAIFSIYIPPLRERKEDIPLLTAHFIKKYSGLNHKDIKEISREALHALTQYDWPGNVRELEKTIERALLICGNGQIDIPHLPFTDQFMMDGSSNKTDHAQENYYISRSNPMPSATLPSATTSRTKKILLVDDEPNVLTLLSRVLTDEGYQVTTSLSRIEAISMAEHTVFDAMTTDICGGQGEMNGIELMERFHKLYPSLPVIIITGNGTIERAIEAMRKGAYDFITKPFELDKISTTVKMALEYGELHLELSRLRKEVQDKYAFNL